MTDVTHIYDRVDAVSLKQRRALMASQRVFPVTHLFDRQGNEINTDDPNKVFSGVCGCGTEWLAFYMSDFEGNPEFVPPDWAYEQEAE